MKEMRKRISEVREMRGRGPRDVPCSLFPAPCPLRPRRTAFTLIEILVVIVIIGILVGLLTGAAVTARTTIRVMGISTEIANLALALDSCKTELGGGSEYPPDFSSTTQARDDLRRFLTRAFPRCPPSRWPAYINDYLQSKSDKLNPSTALYFWLAGPRGNGFSKDPMDPFDTVAIQSARIGPFFDFDRGRADPITPAVAGLEVRTIRPKNDIGNSAPYVYYKAIARSYMGGVFTSGWVWTDPENTGMKPVIMPFVDFVAKTTSDTMNIWISPTTYQILSPGLDGKYDTTSDNVAPRYPQGDNYGRKMRDDITSFSGGRLESRVP